MRVAVYTAIFGDYDFLKPPVKQIGLDCDFFCFSDNNGWKGTFGGWRHIYVRADPRLHPRWQAKRFKLMSHEIFPSGRLEARYCQSPIRPRYEASIWVDGSLRIHGENFARTIAAMCMKNALVVYSHPDRDCIFDEIAASTKMEKYRGLPLVAQGDYYKASGVKAHAGLYACGVIGRSCPEGDQTVRFNEVWWAENVRWSYQDQLSFAFLASREKARIKVIPGSLWDNEFFDWLPHTSAK